MGSLNLNWSVGSLLIATGAGAVLGVWTRPACECGITEQKTPGVLETRELHVVDGEGHVIALIGVVEGSAVVKLFDVAHPGREAVAIQANSRSENSLVIDGRESGHGRIEMGTREGESYLDFFSSRGPLDSSCVVLRGGLTGGKLSLNKPTANVIDGIEHKGFESYHVLHP